MQGGPQLPLHILWRPRHSRHNFYCIFDGVLASPQHFSLHICSCPIDFRCILCGAPSPAPATFNAYFVVSQPSPPSHFVVCQPRPCNFPCILCGGLATFIAYYVLARQLSSHILWSRPRSCPCIFCCILAAKVFIAYFMVSWPHPGNFHRISSCVRPRPRNFPCIFCSGTATPLKVCGVLATANNLPCIICGVLATPQ